MIELLLICLPIGGFCLGLLVGYLDRKELRKVAELSELFAGSYKRQNALLQESLEGLSRKITTMSGGNDEGS